MKCPPLNLRGMDLQGTMARCHDKGFIETSLYTPPPLEGKIAMDISTPAPVVYHLSGPTATAILSRYAVALHSVALLGKATKEYLNQRGTKIRVFRAERAKIAQSQSLATSALTEQNRQKSRWKKRFWAQKSQPEIANR